MQRTNALIAGTVKNLAVGSVKRISFKDPHLNICGAHRILRIDAMVVVILKVTDTVVWVRPLEITQGKQSYTYYECDTGTCTAAKERYSIVTIPTNYLRAVSSIQVDGAFRDIAAKYAERYFTYSTRNDVYTFYDMDMGQRQIDAQFATYYRNNKNQKDVKKVTQTTFKKFEADMQALGAKYSKMNAPIQFDITADNKSMEIMECYWRECVLESVETVNFPCEKDENSYKPLIEAGFAVYTYDNKDVAKLLRKSKIYGLFLKLCEQQTWLQHNCGTNIKFSVGFNREYTDEPANFLLDTSEMSEEELENIDYLFNVYLVLGIEINKNARNINLKPLIVALRELLIKFNRE